VNYYERYCGDYARDTGDLSLQEHGAYTVMLDTYYATETPLPADHRALYRICRAMTAKEQGAVGSVADRFFPIGPDGLRHNKRADQEIADARRRIDAARANGRRGGRPQEKPSGLEHATPVGNPVGLQQEPTGKAPHTPTPYKSKSKALFANANGEWEAFWSKYPNKTNKQTALKRWKRMKAADVPAIMASIEAHKATDQWQRGIIPHASTWLNQRRWEDELTAATKPATKSRLEPKCIYITPDTTDRCMQDFAVSVGKIVVDGAEVQVGLCAGHHRPAVQGSEKFSLVVHPEVAAAIARFKRFCHDNNMAVTT